MRGRGAHPPPVLAEAAVAAPTEAAAAALAAAAETGRTGGGMAFEDYFIEGARVMVGCGADGTQWCGALVLPQPKVTQVEPIGILAFDDGDLISQTMT